VEKTCIKSEKKNAHKKTASIFKKKKKQFIMLHVHLGELILTLPSWSITYRFYSSTDF